MYSLNMQPDLAFVVIRAFFLVFLGHHFSRDVGKFSFGLVRPVKIQISLLINSVWSESSMTAFCNEDSDQTAWMHRLIWVFVRRRCQTCAPSVDSDQPAHSRSLIRIFNGQTLASQGYNEKTLIRLRWCAGWIESSLGAHARRYVFSRWGLFW